MKVLPQTKEWLEGGGVLVEVIFLKTIDCPGLSGFLRKVVGFVGAGTTRGCGFITVYFEFRRLERQ